MRATDEQVEVMASDARGKTVLANFPVFCAVEPPRAMPRKVVAAPETTDPARAEALLLEAVNRDRAAASLPALKPDEALARAARAYSQEMAETQNVDHVSARSGDARDRVRSAGGRVRVVLENVGQANSVAEAQKSFMSSPGIARTCCIARSPGWAPVWPSGARAAGCRPCT